MASESTTVTGAVVETAAGKVRGSAKDGVLVFRGIPYAAAPVGPLRFMPPQPIQPCTGVRDALAYGWTAPQLSPMPPGRAPPAPDPAVKRYPTLFAGGGDPVPENEDCLFLNVWTPSTTGKRAVMFWMHGGGFSTGSGSSTWYEGVNLARKQDVVVVTINHRLNVTGHCDLSRYGDAFAQTGNAGMLDCVAALQWVRDNISAFGGDPDRVLIHGESGGGRKTSMMMAFEPARGLFHRAAVQSGSALRMDGKALAQEKARKLFAELEIAEGDVARLREVPLRDLKRAAAVAMSGLGQWRPVVDGVDLPRQPYDPDAAPLNADIPLIIGTNRTELSAFMGGSGTMDTLSDEALTAQIGSIVPREKAAATVAMYRRLYPASANAEIAYMANTDRGYFLDSTIQAAMRVEARQGPTYLYSFYRETPVADGRYFAPHASEIPFVFDTLANAERMVGAVTPEAQALADQMSACWANFAKTGLPSAPGLPDWTPYSAERPTMVFDYQSRIENDPRGEQRTWMLGFGSQQDWESELNPDGRGGQAPPTGF